MKVFKRIKQWLKKDKKTSPVEMNKWRVCKRLSGMVNIQHSSEDIPTREIFYRGGGVEELWELYPQLRRKEIEALHIRVQAADKATFFWDQK